MLSNNLARLIFSIALVAVCYSVRQTQKPKIPLESSKKQAIHRSVLEDESIGLDGHKYIALFQTKGDTETTQSASGQSLSSAQTQDSSSTIGNDLGKFLVQAPTDTDTDPITSLTQAQNVASQSSAAQAQSNSANSGEQSLINSLVKTQQQAAAKAAAQASATNSKPTTNQAPSQQTPTATEPTSSATSTETTTETATKTEESSEQSTVTQETAPTAATPTASSNNTQPKEVTIKVSVVEQSSNTNNIIFSDGSITTSKNKASQYFTLILIVAVFAFILILVLIRRAIEKYLGDILISRLNSIMKDTIITVVTITFILYIDYIGVFDDRLDIGTICLLFLIFALVWLTISTFLILIGQSFCVNWEETETIVNKREDILGDYKRLYIKKSNNQKLTRPEKKLFDSCRAQLEYILMRQEFIAPTFLPTISEAFLRDDFNFAEYLNYGFERVLNYMFNFSTSSLITIIISISIWATIDTYASVGWHLGILFAIILIMFAMLLLMGWKFGKIYNELVPNVDKSMALPDMFANFTPYKRNPLVCAETRAKIPDFLSMEKAPGKHRRILSSQSVANRHERLFWFGAPKFSIRLIHSLFMTHVFWTVIFLVGYVEEIQGIGKILAAIVVCILMLIDMFYIIPKLIRQYSIISNIQMKRDFAIIDKVILNQRKQTRSTLGKFYRLLKSSRKEMAKETLSTSRLKPFLEKQIIDAFRIIGDDEAGKLIHLKSLKNVVHLCGKEIKRDELVYLARESTKEDYQQIHIEDLIQAIESLSQDVKLEPYNTSKDVLRAMAGGREQISLKELGKIVFDHKVMPKEEISSLLHELKYISTNGQEVGIDHVAAYIRHNLECMPR